MQFSDFYTNDRTFGNPYSFKDNSSRSMFDANWLQNHIPNELEQTAFKHNANDAQFFFENNSWNPTLEIPIWLQTDNDLFNTPSPSNSVDNNSSINKNIVDNEAKTWFPNNEFLSLSHPNKNNMTDHFHLNHSPSDNYLDKFISTLPTLQLTNSILPFNSEIPSMNSVCNQHPLNETDYMQVPFVTGIYYPPACSMLSNKVVCSKGLGKKSLDRSRPFKKSRQNFPKETNQTLLTWLLSNKNYPWPEENVIRQWCVQHNLTSAQINNW